LLFVLRYSHISAFVLPLFFHLQSFISFVRFQSNATSAVKFVNLAEGIISRARARITAFNSLVENEIANNVALTGYYLCVYLHG
jgi:hypothetical protein